MILAEVEKDVDILCQAMGECGQVFELESKIRISCTEESI